MGIFVLEILSEEMDGSGVIFKSVDNHLPTVINVPWWFMWKAGLEYPPDPFFVAGVSKDDSDERWLQLRMDQGYGATRVLANIDERSRCVTRFATPGICELVQLG